MRLLGPPKQDNTESRVEGRLAFLAGWYSERPHKLSRLGLELRVEGFPCKAAGRMSSAIWHETLRPLDSTHLYP